MRHLVECWLVVSLVLTALAGAIGLKVYRFPSANVFVALIHERQPSIYLGLSYLVIHPLTRCPSPIDRLAQ